MYESTRGEKPVEDFIRKQQSQTKAKIIHQIDLLEQYGSRLGMPHSKILGSGIYELRIRGREELRIFYGFNKRIIYLLHGFKKQSRKTPEKELAVARERLKKLLT